MSLADLVAAGKYLGIPGLCVLCFYLLESRKSDREKVKEAGELDRQRANDKRNAALERMKIDAENRRTAALEVGFRSIGDQLGEHGERLAGIEGTLQIQRRKQTPAAGVRVTEFNRAKTGADR